MSQKTGFTEAQTQTLEKITELMREHFDSGILVVESRDLENPDDEGREFVWHGGISSAIGLTGILDTKLRKIATEEGDGED